VLRFSQKFDQYFDLPGRQRALPFSEMSGFERLEQVEVFTDELLELLSGGLLPEFGEVQHGKVGDDHGSDSEFFIV